MAGMLHKRTIHCLYRTSFQVKQCRVMNLPPEFQTLSHGTTKRCRNRCRAFHSPCSGRENTKMLYTVNSVCSHYKTRHFLVTNKISKSFYRRRSAGEKNCVIPNFLQAEKFGNKLAIVCQNGRYTYKELSILSSHLADTISRLVGDEHQEACADGYKDSIQNVTGGSGRRLMFPLDGERVAFLCPNDVSYTVIKWAVWRCGGVAVPLCKSHPASELEYFISDSGARLIVATEEYSEILEPISNSLKVPLYVLSKSDYCVRSGGEVDADISGSVGVHDADVKTEEIHMREERLTEALAGDEYRNKHCMIVYTSGTTGRPKGVVHTFGSVNAQITGMVQAWRWTEGDVVLHVLPLHHVHGIVNVLATSLYCGATCVMIDKFGADTTWSCLLDQSREPAINLFMAVPTIYAKMIEAGNQLKGRELSSPSMLRDTLVSKIRLMVSGSAALPQPIMEKWEELTGHTLLERYGMTEIGMALTNPLHGHRKPGTVGRPFPGVSVQVVSYRDDDPGYDVIVTADCDSTMETPGMEGNSGELLVKGDNVFKEYWNKPEATVDSFTEDRWFKTGDTAEYVDGVFRIVGRTSVDVIKSGGYKISALDIERHLLSHPNIRDVAVVGLPDETWGQIVSAIVVTRGSEALSLEALKTWAADVMAPYHIPRVLKCLPEMPRNAMGKVNKKLLVKDEFPEYFP